MKSLSLSAVLIALLAFSEWSSASSHRDAPFMTRAPKTDITDLFMFQSYDDDNQTTNDRTTLIMNFHPLQDAFGGPTYFFPHEYALYAINIDNNSDGQEDIVFRIEFDFSTDNFNKLTVEADNTTNTEIPFIVAPQPVVQESDSSLNLIETFKVFVVQGDRDTGTVTTSNNVTSGGTTFVKPIDFIGTTTIPDYEQYVDEHIYDFSLPGTLDTGTIFVGQRKDPFVMNLGEVFDGLDVQTGINDLAAKNVTSFCIEVPTSFLVSTPSNPVISGWATVRIPTTRVLTNPVPGSDYKPDAQSGPFQQVSRLGNPLFNELFIGMSHKDRFNATEPQGDNAAGYIDLATASFSIAEIIQQTILPATQSSGRNDLLDFYLAGIDFSGGGGPDLSTGAPGERMRLDTSVTPVDLTAQNPGGLLAGDNAGFPNGRRPIDDVVDITLQVAGGLLTGTTGADTLTDLAEVDGADLSESFPFLGTPTPGDAVVACVEVQSSVTLTGPFVEGRSFSMDAAAREIVIPIDPGTTPREFFRIKSNTQLRLLDTKVSGDDLRIGIDQP